MRRNLFIFLLILILAGSLIFFKFRSGQKSTLVFPMTPTSTPSFSFSEYCLNEKTGEKMNLSKAKEIANNSDCVQQGSLKEEHFCNENTGTWWFDLDIRKEGCLPACVVNVSTKKAEINWRCTGLLRP